MNSSENLFPLLLVWLIVYGCIVVIVACGRVDIEYERCITTYEAYEASDGILCGEGYRCITLDDDTTKCILDICGNGKTERDFGEECDPGEGGDSAAECDRDCTRPACHDGIINLEANNLDCDDENDNNNDFCVGECQIATCGDGYTNDQDDDDQGGEECDDGNLIESDGCTTNCRIPRCTDSEQNGFETDIDCGGELCPPCPLTQKCAADRDCESGICLFNVCQSGRIGSGAAYAGAITEDGHAFLYGENSGGQLNGEPASNFEGIVDSLGPKVGSLFSDFGISFKQISLGYHHSCVLDNHGQVDCWGTLENSKIYDSRSQDTKVQLRKQVAQIETGEVHVCALYEDNTVGCWGMGRDGQLNGNSLLEVAAPGREVKFGEGNVEIVQIAAGSRHTCALDDDGLVWCWGRNKYGTLGNGFLGGSYEPIIAVDLDMKAIQIAAGYAHTCALLADQNQVRCWGSNDSMKLGYANLESAIVAGAEDWPLQSVKFSDFSFIQLAAGVRHTCALVRPQDGGVRQIRCWGNNRHGQLGCQNSYKEIDKPVLVEDSCIVTISGKIVEINAGDYHTCALSITHDSSASDEDLYCWGKGVNEWRYGNQSVENSYEPVKLPQ